MRKQPGNTRLRTQEGNVCGLRKGTGMGIGENDGLSNWRGDQELLLYSVVVYMFVFVGRAFQLVVKSI